jgi:hypothetical protein
MARGVHGLPKVLPWPIIPNPFTPCGWATPKKGLMAVSGVACPQGGRTAPVFYPFRYPMPYGPVEELLLRHKRIHRHEVVIFFLAQIVLQGRALGPRRGVIKRVEG